MLRENSSQKSVLPFWAAAPKGTMSCRTQGTFVRLSVCPFVPPHPKAQILASRLKSQPRGSNPSLEAQIPALRLKSQPQGSNPSLKAQIPASRLKSQPFGSNPSHGAQIPASRLKSQPRGSNPSFESQIPALRLKSAHKDGQTNRRTNKQTIKRKSPCVLQDIVPFWPLPKRDRRAETRPRSSR